MNKNTDDSAIAKPGIIMVFTGPNPGVPFVGKYAMRSK
jgi:hypothetical protein